MYLLNLIYFANSRIKVIKYHAISSQEENTSLNWMRKKHLIDNFRVEQTNQTKRKQYHTKRRTRYKSQHLDRRAHLEIRSTLHPRAPNSHIHFFQKPKNSIGRREWLDDYIKKLPSIGGAGVNEPGPFWFSGARPKKRCSAFQQQEIIQAIVVGVTKDRETWQLPNQVSFFSLRVRDVFIKVFSKNLAILLSSAHMFRQKLALSFIVNISTPNHNNSLNILFNWITVQFVHKIVCLSKIDSSSLTL